MHKPTSANSSSFASDRGDDIWLLDLDLDLDLELELDLELRLHAAFVVK